MPSRPFDFRLWFGLPLIFGVLMLVIDPIGVDFALAHMLYDPQRSFIGRDSSFLEDVLHDRAKQLVIVIGVLAIAGFVASLLPTPLRRWRRPLGYLVLALGLSTSIVTPLKALTGVQCPWSLNEFGGDQAYAPLFGVHPATDKPGRCWPGGHASAGFSLLALFFVLRDRKPRLAKAALVGALALGTVFSLSRMAQGAHFLSHNLWTLLFDWLICLACYRLVLYRKGPARMAPDGTWPHAKRLWGNL
ncbi:phosphatase PAP2 family protein [Stutzerimonas azotifigens]|uniref:Phosphatase PAP2 family protein n=1 Tax=Stutzerimonas azotifigens TaxID=291995 RepID=A0ABR5YX46_9GAMM|nr:phosphatase PAP2 family protein [Stutzerimonas azotifigens]MBA1272493.1 phosphatase PAP2 family protein [Stutzerimonas azotifigens]